MFSTPIRSLFCVSIQSHITKHTMGHFDPLTDSGLHILSWFYFALLFWVTAGSDALDMSAQTATSK